MHAGNVETPEYMRAQNIRRANLNARWMVASTVGLVVGVPVLAWTVPRVLAVVLAVALFVWVVKLIPGKSWQEIVGGAAFAVLVGWYLGWAGGGHLSQIPPPPWWVWPPLAAAALVTLGVIGRPRGKPLVAPGQFHGASIPMKPSKEMVIDALCRIGLPGMTLQQAERVHEEVRVIAPGVATSAHGYTIELELVPGVTSEMVASKRAELAGALRRDLGCVWPSGNEDKHPGYLRLFLSHRPMNSGKQPAWPIADGKALDIFDPMELFTDEEMRWVKLAVAQTPHLAVGGASGFGKSVWLRQLAVAISFDPRVRLVVFDGKRSGDLDCTRKLAHGFYEGSEDDEVQDVIAALQGIVVEIRRRQKFLKTLPADERSPKVTSALATKYVKDLAPIVLLADEIQEYTEYGVKGVKPDMEIRKVVVSLLTTIGRVGRSAGVFMVLCSQKPDAGVIPSSIMGNCSIRIAFKVSEQTHNDQILGTSARKNGIDATQFGSRDKGMAWLKGGDSVDAQVVRSWSKLAHPTEGLALADELTDKALAIRTSRGLLTGMAAGEETEDDEITVDVIADALSVVDSPDHGGRNISLQMLAHELRALRPTWAKLDQVALGALLRAKQVRVDAVHCPVEGRSMQGVKRDWLLKGDDE